MLGMMNKGGGSTNSPVLPQQAGAMPSKGGGSTNAPVPPTGMPATPGTGLASLFMNNQPAGPVTGSPAQLPTITQPRVPVIPMPVQHPVAPPPAAPATPAWSGPINTRADVMNYKLAYDRAGPQQAGMVDPEQMRQNFIRGRGNYWGRNSGHGGR